MAPSPAEEAEELLRGLHHERGRWMPAPGHAAWPCDLHASLASMPPLRLAEGRA